MLETGSEQSNITNYTYDKSIENIRTRVRLLSNENAVVYERTNEELEAAIGTFMEVKSVSDSYNDAQIQELVDSVFDERVIRNSHLRLQVKELLMLYQERQYMLLFHILILNGHFT